jgi:hypothetical protein
MGCLILPVLPSGFIFLEFHAWSDVYGFAASYLRACLLMR